MSAARCGALLARAIEIIQLDRDALVECHTMPFGDLATLDDEARDGVERYDAWLTDARDALGVSR